MTILHSGTTKKFSANWGNVFGANGEKTKGTAKSQAAATLAKADAKSAAKSKSPQTKAVKKTVATKETAKLVPSKKAQGKKK